MLNLRFAIAAYHVKIVYHGENYIMVIGGSSGLCVWNRHLDRRMVQVEIRRAKSAAKRHVPGPGVEPLSSNPLREPKVGRDEQRTSRGRDSDVAAAGERATRELLAAAWPGRGLVRQPLSFFREHDCALGQDSLGWLGGTDTIFSAPLSPTEGRAPSEGRAP